MKSFFKSFTFAIKGVFLALQQERNFKIQIGIAIVVILFGLYFKINKIEWVAILLCIALVLSLEMLNSAMERLCNFVAPQYHKQIGEIKDLAAGAVLMASIITIAIGLLIFYNHLKWT